LSDTSRAAKIVDYGKYCTKKLLEKPSIENLFLLSYTFAKKTNLLEKRTQEAIDSANKFGMASMCMLGNSVFAIGETKELYKTLSLFGKVFICTIDEIGARILED
jgi:pantoate kinase